MHVLQALIGKENYCSIPLEKFENMYYLSSLFGKLVNITIETNAKSAVYDSMFKAIVSGDSITVDQKYLPPFKFNPFCKLVFAVNQMPRVNDKTDAFFRRLLILRCNRQFKEAEQNKKLRYELIEEIDGIFLWALSGLKRLEARGYFERPKRVLEEVKAYQTENNNVLAFVGDECEVKPDAFITKKEFYTAYKDWCRENGYKEVAKKRLGIEIMRHFPEIKDGRTADARTWTGITTTGPAIPLDLPEPSWLETTPENTVSV